MFCDRKTGLFTCLLLVCFCFGCSKRPGHTVERIAVSPFENLSGDPALKWMGEAVPTVLVTELTGTPRIQPFELRRASDTPPGAAGKLLQGYISTVGNQLRVSAFLVDLSSNKTADNFIISGPLANGILPLAGAIARRLDARARPYSTRNPEALKLYVEALAKTDPAAIVNGFEEAVARDANFGAVYVSWCQFLASRGDRAGAERVIETARSRGNQIPEPDRARLDVTAALLHGDTASQIRAMVALSRFMPADAGLFERIGAAQVQGHQYGAAVEWHKKAVAADPSNYLRLNQLAYAQCWAHDLEGARDSLLKYQKMRPRDANPLDSLGDVHYYWGRFGDAEKYYLRASEKDPAFLGGGSLLKAAHARLMAGDITGADQIYQKYAALRRDSNDALAGYRQAQWDFLCGRRKQAIERMKQFGNRAADDAASLAWSQLAIWHLETGDGERARESASRAVAAARSPGPVRQAAVSAYLAAPRQFPAPPEAMLQKIAQGYALLFNKQFAAASPVFQELFDKTMPSDPSPYGILLAWTLIETGRVEAAAALLTPNPLPNPDGEDLLESVAFPRSFHLRSVVLGTRKKMAESLGYHQLFLELSGDMPMIWDRK